jgi:hypothetical protein
LEITGQVSAGNGPNFGEIVPRVSLDTRKDPNNASPRTTAGGDIGARGQKGSVSAIPKFDSQLLRVPVAPRFFSEATIDSPIAQLPQPQKSLPNRGQSRPQPTAQKTQNEILSERKGSGFFEKNVRLFQRDLRGPTPEIEKDIGNLNLKLETFLAAGGLAQLPTIGRVTLATVTPIRGNSQTDLTGTSLFVGTPEGLVGSFQPKTGAIGLGVGASAPVSIPIPGLGSGMLFGNVQLTAPARNKLGLSLVGGSLFSQIKPRVVTNGAKTRVANGGLLVGEGLKASATLDADIGARGIGAGQVGFEQKLNVKVPSDTPPVLFGRGGLTKAAFLGRALGVASDVSAIAQEAFQDAKTSNFRSTTREVAIVTVGQAAASAAGRTAAGALAAAATGSGQGEVIGTVVPGFGNVAGFVIGGIAGGAAYFLGVKGAEASFEPIVRALESPQGQAAFEKAIQPDVLGR